jgi:hypothetical protein
MFKIFSISLSLLAAGVIFHNPFEGVAAIDEKRQKAACSYALSPAGNAFDSEGGAGNINVTATGDCPWRATSNVPSWITITSGASGTGNGTVGYQVAPNTTVSRSGTVTVADQTYSVDQTASPCCQVSTAGNVGASPVSTHDQRRGEGQ